MKITLLGFSETSTIVLLDVAADANRIKSEQVEVKIVLNMMQSEAEIRDKWPLPQSQLTICTKEQWTPALSEVVMPGVMSASVCKAVIEDFEMSCGLQREKLGTIIHPTAAIAQSSIIRPGTWIHPNVSVSSMTDVGFCVGLNRNSSIGHHCKLHNFVRINPGAHIAGSCEIGEAATIAIGAHCLEKTKVGAHALVGAGALVTRNVDQCATVIGTPARPILKKRG